jgi:hypothetical protein
MHMPEKRALEQTAGTMHALEQSHLHLAELVASWEIENTPLCMCIVGQLQTPGGSVLVVYADGQQMRTTHMMQILCPYKVHAVCRTLVCVAQVV